MKNFNELSEREVLALAISLEEEDERVYADFSEGLRQEFPASATVFDSMRKEESEHRRRLIEPFASRLAPSKSKLAGSMNGPRHAPRTPASVSFWTISRRRNARTKIEPRN